MDVTFSNPLFLWFLALIPLLAAVHYYSLHFARQRALRFANFEALEKILQSKPVVPNNYLMLAIRVLALVCFTLAASGITLSYRAVAPGHDMVVAVDTSSSMLSQDLPPTRMGAVQSALGAWLASLPQGSEAGLVTFSSQASLASPLTQDLQPVKQAVQNIAPDKSGGTAICEALRASTNELLMASGPRAIVLISDGQNNAGCLLSDGIAYAKKNNATIFSIGVGSKGGGTVDSLPGILFTLDETDLRLAAAETGGNYTRAESPAQVSSALSALSVPVQRTISMPIGPYVMLAAFLLVFVDWSLSVTRYRAIP